MSTPTTTPELVPFNSGLRSKVRAIVVRAPEVQDARFQPKPGGIMPEAAIDHAAGLMRSGLRANQIKYLAELHPVTSPADITSMPRVLGECVAVPLSIDDILGEAELRLEPARGETADLPALKGPVAFDASGSLLDYPAPVRYFGDDMKIEVQPKSAAFMVAPAEVAGMTGKTPVVSRSWSDEAVDAAGADRAAKDEATCARLGLALPPAFFALGTTLVDIGVDNARKSREEFEALPRAVEACAALEAEVIAEDRKPVAVGLSDLRLTERGLLARDADVVTGREGFAYGVERDAMQRLQADLRAKLAAGGDLGVVTGLGFKEPAIVAGAAGMWNGYTAALKAREVKSGDRKQVSLLTRMVEVGEDKSRMRQVFAAVSEKYGEVNAGKIARACADLCEGIERRAEAQGKTADVRAEVVYDRSSVSIDLITHTNIAAEAQTVGDLFQGGLRVTSDDTGGGSLKVRAFGRRVACRNYTIVSADGAVTLIRHIGDPAHLLGRLQEALQASSGALATFAVQWGKACSTLAARDLLRNLETDRKRRDELATLVDTLGQQHADRGALWAKAQAEVLDGIYRSILAAHDLAPSKLIEDEVHSLASAYYDRRNAGEATAMSPAAISNGLTLWAQGKGRHTADAAEVLAGQIVSGDEVLAWIGAPARAA